MSQGRPDRELVVVLDCADLARAATFWSTALGYVSAGPASPTYQSLHPADGNGFELLLQKVAEGKFGEPRTDRSPPDLHEQ